VIVYRFGCCGGPLDDLDLVMAQMRLAHDYANDHTAIERGRRAALHAVDDTPEAREAAELVRAATKSTRKAAVTALRQARRAARAAAPDELARIAALDEAIRRDARALTQTYWGNYLTVEASAQQQRAMPLYEDDAVTPALPRFRRWVEEGQVSVQLQRGVATSAVRTGQDTRVRLDRGDRKVHKSGRVTEYADLWIRIGSSGTAGRDPVWTRVRAILHRQIPDAAQWKWVRLSRRREGRSYAWSVEITVNVERPARTLDTSIVGVLAVEPAWYERASDGAFVCATTRDDKGVTSDVVLPTRVVGAMRKAADIRAVRDTLSNAAREDVRRLLVESRDSLPVWLIDACQTMHLWKSPERMYRLARRWRDERCDAARESYDRVQAWEMRDDHLWRYEADSRGQAVRSRNDYYHVLAATWARSYRHAIVPRRDYSREARFGTESDLRFLSSPSSLVGAIDAAYDGGASAYEAPWVRLGDPHADEDKDARGWAALAIERFGAGDPAVTARKVRKNSESSDNGDNAWARRKKAKADKIALQGIAREPDANPADPQGV